MKLSLSNFCYFSWITLFKLSIQNWLYSVSYYIFKCSTSKKPSLCFCLLSADHPWFRILLNFPLLQLCLLDILHYILFTGFALVFVFICNFLGSIFFAHVRLFVFVLVACCMLIVYEYRLKVSVLPSYRKQSIDLLCKSIDCFLYEDNTGT